VTRRPSLLGRLKDWDDHPAWHEFVACYEPLLRRWCLGFGLDAEATEELCQGIWIELAWKMRTFCYDSGRTFRGWLRTLLHSRALDLVRKQQSARARALPREPIDVTRLEAAGDDPEGGEGVEPRRLALLREAGAAQEVVRGQVEPDTWQAFWSVVIDGRSVRETADELGKTYRAVYAASRRVGCQLRTEGERRLALLRARDHQACSPAPANLIGEGG
jgi:RNA polymerase sigma-70 factor (ECF subfamily)